MKKDWFSKFLPRWFPSMRAKSKVFFRKNASRPYSGMVVWSGVLLPLPCMSLKNKPCLWSPLPQESQRCGLNKYQVKAFWKMLEFSRPFLWGKQPRMLLRSLLVSQTLCVRPAIPPQGSSQTTSEKLTWDGHKGSSREKGFIAESFPVFLHLQYISWALSQTACHQIHSREP